MDKIFVITYKRPALPIEKMTMSIDQAYDCETVPNEELANIRLRDAQNKYEDVDMFECDAYEFLEFMKNEKSVTNFTRTGEHSMKSIDEDVEAGTEQKTVDIYLKYILTGTQDSNFDFQTTIDDVGQIVITPNSTDASFTHVQRCTKDCEISDSIENNVRTATLMLSANMISEDNNFSYFLDIDEVGQIVVTPDSEKTSFLTVSTNGSLNLVTEALDPTSDEFANLKEEVMTLTDSIDEKLGEVIDSLELIKDHFRTMGIHYLDIDGYFINYLESFREEDSIGMCIGELRNRVTEYEENYDSEDLNESLNEGYLDSVYRNLVDIRDSASKAFWTLEHIKEEISLEELDTSDGYTGRLLEEDINHLSASSERILDGYRRKQTAESLQESASIDEVERQTIIDKFMKGELTIDTVSMKPEGTNFVELTELTATEHNSICRYFYDTESGAIACWLEKHE